MEMVYLSKNELENIIDLAIEKSRKPKNKVRRDFEAEILSMIKNVGRIELTKVRDNLRTSETNLYKAINELEKRGQIVKLKNGKNVSYELNLGE